MKYSIYYTEDNDNTQYLNDVEEIRIRYNPRDNTLGEFLKLHQDKQRVSIVVPPYRDEWISIIEFFKAGAPVKNISLMMDWDIFEWDKTYYDMAKEMGLHVYFKDPITSWDALESVSFYTDEIILSGAICFELQDVREFARKKGLKIHVVPHVASGTGDNIKRFFVLPEDTSVYEEFIDYFDILELNHTDVILKSYVQEKWFGDDGFLIEGLGHGSLDGRRHLSLFGKRRTNCHKKCIKGGTCNMCGTLAELSRTLEEKDIWIQSKDKYEVIN